MSLSPLASWLFVLAMTVLVIAAVFALVAVERREARREWRELDRYAHARRRVAEQQRTSHTRIGHKDIDHD